MEIVYLDNAATTRPDLAVVVAMREMLEDRWGNPSSAHDIGSRARTRLDESRTEVARLIGCQDDEVFFTSGGTEADNWAILGVLDSRRGEKDHLITAPTEHHAVYDTAKWWEERGGRVTWLPVDGEGRIDPAEVARAFTSRTALVSVMHVNNELGTIQDASAIGAICREKEVLFHTDCVQSYGKFPLRFSDLNADLVSISSHKIYGPKGVGALVIRRGTRISPRCFGGSQERGLRTGTENVPGIVGFGAAAKICRERLTTEATTVQAMRDRLEEMILDAIPSVRVNGSREHRAPGLLSVAFRGCEGESLLVALDRKGFCVSTGSACSAGALGASHVLMGIGLDVPTAQSTIRFSFGRFNKPDDVDRLMNVLPTLVARQRETAPVSVR
ncbi:cysteine desulfurase [bacterium]|nr:cysteine desulfurase [bacterium]MBU1985393.1 cysteine desulfurase [bacterium]